MDAQWSIAPFNPEWRTLFLELGSKLRESLGDKAVRIDHIGSTSIEGMEAKPIIDIQISVEQLEDEASYRPLIERVGFQFRSENPDQTKRYFREMPGARRTHIHVRQKGSYSEQVSLLFRDYLRHSPEDCQRYIQEKHRLMSLYKHERPKYVEGKGPIVWDILQKAHIWTQDTGWKPAATDA